MNISIKPSYIRADEVEVTFSKTPNGVTTNASPNATEYFNEVCVPASETCPAFRCKVRSYYGLALEGLRAVHVAGRIFDDSEIEYQANYGGGTTMVIRNADLRYGKVVKLKILELGLEINDIWPDGDVSVDFDVLEALMAC